MTISCLVLAGVCCLVTATSSGATEAASETIITLVGEDYPEYQQELGILTLPGMDAAALAAIDPQYLRLSLADSETVPFLPKGYSVYQTVTTGVDLPLSVNLVVDGRRHGMCFNPEIPYCSSFDKLNPLLLRRELQIDSVQKAGELARFVVELGTSSVHHPENFLYLRLAQDFGVEFFNFIRNIEAIYDESIAPFRSEARRQEVKRVTETYRDRIRPCVVEADGDGFRLHGFTYQIMSDGGPLFEWDVFVHQNGTVDAGVTILEEHVGELSWPFAP